MRNHPRLLASTGLFAGLVVAWAAGCGSTDSGAQATLGPAGGTHDVVAVHPGVDLLQELADGGRRDVVPLGLVVGDQGEPHAVPPLELFHSLLDRRGGIANDDHHIGQPDGIQVDQ